MLRPRARNNQPTGWAGLRRATSAPVAVARGDGDHVGDRPEGVQLRQIRAARVAHQAVEDDDGDDAQQRHGSQTNGQRLTSAWRPHPLMVAPLAAVGFRACPEPETGAGPEALGPGRAKSEAPPLSPPKGSRHVSGHRSSAGRDTPPQPVPGGGARGRARAGRRRPVADHAVVPGRRNQPDNARVLTEIADAVGRNQVGAVLALLSAVLFAVAAIVVARDRPRQVTTGCVGRRGTGGLRRLRTGPVLRVRRRHTR